jgi:hypothetical protein
MVTYSPYGIELDSDWRDRAGLNGHGPAKPKDTRRPPSPVTHAPTGRKHSSLFRASTSPVWHASKFTREVLDGLLRICFLYHQQIIWDKGRTVLNRTHGWFQHEPCWYARKKNAARYTATQWGGF